MVEISYRRHRFPPVIIQHAVWLYLRVTLSYRDVEELLAERGLDISYETVRCWVLKFGPVIARRLRRCGPRPITPLLPLVLVCSCGLDNRSRAMLRPKLSGKLCTVAVIGFLQCRS